MLRKYEGRHAPIVEILDCDVSTEEKPRRSVIGPTPAVRFWRDGLRQGETI
jgi:hypothetical protein